MPSDKEKKFSSAENRSDIPSPITAPVQVGHRRETISIVAGGWSVKSILDKIDGLPGYVIGINESGVLLKRANAIVTMDRLWAENRWQQIRLRSVTAQSWIRRSAMKNIKFKGPWLHVFDCDYKSDIFSVDRHALNGNNSGYCGLNLAYQFFPKKVYLFGFDMQRGKNGEPYWHEEYQWRPGGATSSGKFKEWVRSFEMAALQFRRAGIEVFNVNTRSLINTFPVIHPREVL